MTPLFCFICNIRYRRWSRQALIFQVCLFPNAMTTSPGKHLPFFTLFPKVCGWFTSDNTPIGAYPFSGQHVWKLHWVTALDLVPCKHALRWIKYRWTLSHGFLLHCASVVLRYFTDYKVKSIYQLILMILVDARPTKHEKTMWAIVLRGETSVPKKWTSYFWKLEIFRQILLLLGLLLEMYWQELFQLHDTGTAPWDLLCDKFSRIRGLRL